MAPQLYQCQPPHLQLRGAASSQKPPRRQAEFPYLTTNKRPVNLQIFCPSAAFLTQTRHFYCIHQPSASTTHWSDWPQWTPANTWSCEHPAILQEPSSLSLHIATQLSMAFFLQLLFHLQCGTMQHRQECWLWKPRKCQDSSGPPEETGDVVQFTFYTFTPFATLILSSPSELKSLFTPLSKFMSLAQTWACTYGTEGFTVFYLLRKVLTPPQRKSLSPVMINSLSSLLSIQLLNEWLFQGAQRIIPWAELALNYRGRKCRKGRMHLPDFIFSYTELKSLWYCSFAMSPASISRNGKLFRRRSTNQWWFHQKSQTKPPRKKSKQTKTTHTKPTQIKKQNHYRETDFIFQRQD